MTTRSTTRSNVTPSLDEGELFDPRRKPEEFEALTSHPFSSTSKGLNRASAPANPPRPAVVEHGLRDEDLSAGGEAHEPRGDVGIEPKKSRRPFWVISVTLSEVWTAARRPATHRAWRKEYCR